MKTLVITALIGATFANVNVNAGTSPASLPPANIAKETVAPIDPETQTLIDWVEFHQHNVDVVWQQYDAAVTAIKNKEGGTRSLESQMKSLIAYYQNDIDQGVRVDDSKKAIAEIRGMYGKKIAKQAKAEANEIARLQRLLGNEIEREENEFNALVKASAEQVNGYSKPVIKAAEQAFSQATVRIEALKGMDAFASR